MFLYKMSIHLLFTYVSILLLARVLLSDIWESDRTILCQLGFKNIRLMNIIYNIITVKISALQ